MMLELLVQIKWLEFLKYLSPLLAVISAAVVLLVYAAFSKKDDHDVSWWLALFGLAAGFALAWWIWPVAQLSSVLMLSLDRFAVMGWIIVLIAAVLATMMSRPYLLRQNVRRQDYYGLLLLAVFGMGMLVSASDLVSVILGLETMSVAAYALTGYTKGRESSVEGALKYFLMGAFATGFFVMGLAFILGSVGTTDIPTIAARAVDVAASGGRVFFLFGVAMIVVGFAFKVALVPFHAWAPDAYDGAPTPITAFMATGVKAAAFIAFIRFASAVAAGGGILWHHLMWGLSITTMIFGNLAAIRQDNLKRMLAYSSIAHAGYMLVVFPSLVFGTAGAIRAIIFYLVSYILMTAGAFACLVALEGEADEPVNISRLAGLSNRRPFLSAAFALLLLSLAGFPPTLGFFGKYYLFLAAIQNGDVWLVVAAVMASVVSVYFYLRPVVAMYFGDAKELPSETMPAGELAAVSPILVAVIVLALMAVITLGVFPQNLVTLVQGSIF